MLIAFIEELRANVRMRALMWRIGHAIPLIVQVKNAS